MKWRTLADAKVPEIDAFVRAATEAGQEVHVGTDSLQTGRWTQFVTVIAVLTPGKGGRAAYSREVVPRIVSLRERLLKEVWRSVEIALSLSGSARGEMTVHVDANPEERYMSSRYVQELVGMVVGQGFRARIKPEAWCASHAADHVVRTMGKLPRGFPRARAAG